MCVCLHTRACSLVRSGSHQAFWESEKQVPEQSPPLPPGCPGKPRTSNACLLWRLGLITQHSVGQA